jgi:hypothetical protein
VVKDALHCRNKRYCGYKGKSTKWRQWTTEYSLYRASIPHTALISDIIYTQHSTLQPHSTVPSQFLGCNFYEIRIIVHQIHWTNRITYEIRTSLTWFLMLTLTLNLYINTKPTLYPNAKGYVHVASLIVNYPEKSTSRIEGYCSTAYVGISNKYLCNEHQPFTHIATYTHIFPIYIHITCYIYMINRWRTPHELQIMFSTHTIQNSKVP